jgi:hypothetical protein
MSKRLVTLAGDLASFNNVDPAEALDALRSGLTGETEPLKRFGVNINQAALNAKALSLGLVKSSADMGKVRVAQLRLTVAQAAAVKVGKDAKATDLDRKKAISAVRQAEAALATTMQGKVPQLNAAQKAQAAYALILEQTKTAQGDFTRTSGGLANQQRILSAQWTDMKAKVGGVLLPAVTGIVKFFNGSLLPSIGGVSKAFDPVKRAISEVRDGFSNFAAGKTGTHLYDFGVQIADSFATAKKVAHDFFQGLRSEAGPSGDSVFDLGVRIKTIGEHLFDGVKVNVKPLVSSITTQLRNLGQPIVDALQYGLQTGDFTRVGSALSTALAATINGAGAGLAAITKAFGSLLGKVDWVGVGIAVGRQLPALLIGLAAGILNLDFAGLLKGLAANWQAVLFAVIAVAFAPAKLLAKVSEVLHGVPLAGSLLGWAFDAFAVFSKGLRKYVGDFLGFLGREFVVGLRQAGITIGQGWGSALAQFPLRLTILAGRLGGEIGAFIGKIVGFFLKNNGRLARAAGDAVGTILKAFKDMGADLFRAGADLIGWLAKGMLSRLKDVGAAVGKIAGKIRGFFPGSPVAEGPLTSWNGGGAGKRLVGLLAAGLGSTAPVETAVARLASAITLPVANANAQAAAVGLPVAPQHHYWTINNPTPEPASVTSAQMLRRLSFLQGAA